MKYYTPERHSLDVWLVPRDKQPMYMTNYALFKRCGVPKSTIGNLVNCTYDSVVLRVLHELCQGLGISLTEFFDSPLFDEGNLEP